jgi:hypothetical protein
MPGNDPQFVADGATERQPLLPPPNLADAHNDRDAASSTETQATLQIVSHTVRESRVKLGACSLNFFLSGIAMAAVGVGTTTYEFLAESS